LEKGKTPDKPRLGRGLASLIPGGLPQQPIEPKANATSDDSVDGVRSIAVSQIVPNTLQPRTVFNEDALQELADSIREHGVLQAILVRPRLGGGYELIAGERRFRAAQIAGLDRVPAVVRQTSDEDALAIALIENIQREDLNAIEAARGYRQLLDRFGLTQSDLARQIGKAQPTIANSLRLLRLPEPIQDSIAVGKITEEHGKALLSLADDDARIKLWQQILQRGMTVADTRRAAIEMSRTPTSAAVVAKPAPQRDVHWASIEDRLRGALGYKIGLKPAPKGGATLTIELSSAEDIEDILDRLSIRP